MEAGNRERTLAANLLSDKGFCQAIFKLSFKYTNSVELPFPCKNENLMDEVKPPFALELQSWFPSASPGVTSLSIWYESFQLSSLHFSYIYVFFSFEE